VENGIIHMHVGDYKDTFVTTVLGETCTPARIFWCLILKTGDKITVSERGRWDKPVSHTFINPDTIFIHGSGFDCGPCDLLRRYGELLLNGNTTPVGMHFWGDCSLHQLWLKIKIAYVPG
jgi:hypothetical protein